MIVCVVIVVLVVSWEVEKDWSCQGVVEQTFLNLVFVVAAAVVTEAEEAHMSSHATERGGEGPLVLSKHHRTIPRYTFTFVYLP